MTAAEVHANRAAARVALREAEHAAERAYREAVAPIMRERDRRREAAAAAYEKATGRKA